MCVDVPYSSEICPIYKGENVIVDNLEATRDTYQTNDFVRLKTPLPDYCVSSWTINHCIPCTNRSD